MRLPTTCFAALLVLACGESSSPAPEPTPEPTPEPMAEVDVDDPSLCATCHEAVVDEWRTSMHARAHHESDPVYGAMRTLRMERQGAQLAGRCAQCHGPRDPSDPDSAVARTAVSCATCHNLEGVDTADGARGAGALSFNDAATLRGPHDIAEGAPAPHGTGAAAPWLTDGRTVCLACHEAMANPAGAATCTTGPEHEEVEDGEPCTSCHMPTVESPAGEVSERTQHRSHAFLGPHTLYDGADPSFMATAVELTATLADGTLQASLQNRSGHAVPTGFPGRIILVRVTGFDVDGEAVFHNFTDDPMAQDPAAVLNKVYVNDAGEPVMPPFATRLARDTRLAPNEARSLRWTVPETVVRAELTLLFRLLPPPAAEQLGLADAPEAGPRPILTVTVTEDGSEHR